MLSSEEFINFAHAVYNKGPLDQLLVLKEYVLGRMKSKGCIYYYGHKDVHGIKFLTNDLKCSCFR